MRIIDTFQVSHTEDFGKLPDFWEGYWVALLPAKAITTYTALRDPHLANTEVSMTRFAHYLGISKAKFTQAVQELDDLGFVSLDKEEHPPLIDVYEVPEPPVDAALPETTVVNQTGIYKQSVYR